jgi:hypothetical protein
MNKVGMAALAAALGVALAVTPAVAQQTQQGGQSGRNAVTPQSTPQSGATAQQGKLSDTTVQKVGTALRQMASIRQEYSERAQATPAPQQQKELTDQAQTEMVKVISDQGLSVQQYNQVIQMAQADPALKERLLQVAQSGD